MREINVAMAMIVQADEYLLQLRTKKTENGAIGKTGCFGGQIEDEDDDSYAAVSREIEEETQIGSNPELVTPADNFRRLGMVHVQSDRDGQPALINAEVFELLLEYGIPVKALKGELVRMRLDDVSKARAKGELTPATATAFTKFYGV